MKNNSIRKTTAIAALFFASVSPIVINAQNMEVSSETRSEIEKLNKSIETSISKKSFGDVANLYSNDATLIKSDGKKLHGSKEIGAFWYQMANCSDFKSEITELGGNGKLVYQLGKWTMKVEKDGQTVTNVSDVVLVWQRESNYEYKIHLQSINNSVSLGANEKLPNSAEFK